jgi:hypothetical protein
MLMSLEQPYTDDSIVIEAFLQAYEDGVSYSKSDNQEKLKLMATRLILSLHLLATTQTGQQILGPLSLLASSMRVLLSLCKYNPVVARTERYLHIFYTFFIQSNSTGADDD